ncbi:hypothetical protein PQX77_009757 [Marasmius sp. AFHP31]|nr:hypothetical protein PQX77_009757 [Marasmius sp. AFHP31]
MAEIRNICDDPHSKSQYFEYGSEGFKNGVRHLLASSSQVAQLVVQPASPKDLCEIMKVLKKHKAQFAVKGGGHAMAPTFSSTTGIQIAMIRFSRVQYYPESQQVKIGSGCLWDQVYRALDPTGRNVVGGASAEGVGVSGWLLGGGYSLKSNRHGLGIDNIVAINIVTPDGRFRQVTADPNDKDHSLFQALRGGGNNFGIVTSFTLKTFAQYESYGLYFTISGERETEFKEALVKFVEEEDRPEACVVSAFRHELVRGKCKPEYNISIFCVYDGEKPNVNEPFQCFTHLQNAGDSWGADPADWQLGRTYLSRAELVYEPAGTPSVKATLDLTETHPARSDDSPPPKYNNLSSIGGFQKLLVSNTYGFASFRSSLPDDHVVDEFDSFHSNIDSSDFFANSNCARQGSPTVKARGYSARNSTTDSARDFNYDPEDPEKDVERYRSRHGKKLDRGIVEGGQAPAFDAKKPMTKKIDKMGEFQERGRFACLMITKYTRPLLDKMEEEAKEAARHIKSQHGIAVVIDAWPVHKTIFANSPPGAAYPHDRDRPCGPMLVYFRWLNEKDDEFWLAKLEGTLDRIRVVAEKHQLMPEKPAYYSNLSPETMPAHEIYGDNMKWLQEVKAKYDPTDVMSRCGGHKIPLPEPKENHDVGSGN